MVNGEGESEKKHLKMAAQCLRDCRDTNEINSSQNLLIKNGSWEMFKGSYEGFGPASVSLGYYTVSNGFSTRVDDVETGKRAANHRLGFSASMAEITNHCLEKFKVVNALFGSVLCDTTSNYAIY